VNPDEIYLANFPFGGSAGMKLRPVLLLTGPIGEVPEVLVAYISSVIPSTLLPSDVVLDPATGDHASTSCVGRVRRKQARWRSREQRPRKSRSLLVENLL
jgi:hypothetical protein